MILLAVIFLAGISFSSAHLHGDHVCSIDEIKQVPKNFKIQTEGWIDVIHCIYYDEDHKCLQSATSKRRGVVEKTISKNVTMVVPYHYCCDGFKEVGDECQEIIKCGEHICYNGGECVDDKCDCSGTGYGGDDCSKDVNECSQKDICDQKCTNTIGSYFCSCNQPYRLDGVSKCVLDKFYCHINDVVYKTGEVGHNHCQVCDPVQNQYKWSTAEDGSFCVTHGEKCLKDTHCSSGTCVGTPYSCPLSNQVCNGYGGCSDIRKRSFLKFKDFGRYKDLKEPIDYKKDSFGKLPESQLEVNIRKPDYFIPLERWMKYRDHRSFKKLPDKDPFENFQEDIRVMRKFEDPEYLAKDEPTDSIEDLNISRDYNLFNPLEKFQDYRPSRKFRNYELWEKTDINDDQTNDYEKFQIEESNKDSPR